MLVQTDVNDAHCGLRALTRGAFEEDRLVGLFAVGCEGWAGQRTAYDVFTGIVPSHRGRGLAGELFDAAVRISTFRWATNMRW